MKPNRILKLYRDVLQFTDYLVDRWAYQFDVPPKFPFGFHIKRGGMLCLNDHPICQVEEIDLSSEEIDTEHFAFLTYNGDCFFFLVDWFFDSLVHGIDVFKNGTLIFSCQLEK